MRIRKPTDAIVRGLQIVRSLADAGLDEYEDAMGVDCTQEIADAVLAIQWLDQFTATPE